MKKRVFSLLLALTLALGPAPARAAEDQDAGFFTAGEIAVLGGDAEEWRILSEEKGPKHADVYGWYLIRESMQRVIWGHTNWYRYATGNFKAILDADGNELVGEKREEFIADCYLTGTTTLKSESKEMYAYLTGDGLSFLEAMTPEERAEADKIVERRNITFADVNEGDWYYDAVMTLARNGVVEGKGDGTFDPYGNITVGEMAALICRIDKDIKPYPFVPGETLNTERFGERSFDEPTSWAHEYIMGVRKGLGMPNKVDYIPWNPEAYGEPVRRGEAMQICVRFARHMTKYAIFAYNDTYGGWMWQGGWRPGSWDKEIYDAVGLVHASENGGLFDSSEHYWRSTSVAEAFSMGIVHGKGADGDPAAYDCLTRAEFCQMLCNMGVTDSNTVGNNGVW